MEYCTPAENTKHALLNGRKPRGSANKCSKDKIKHIKSIRELFKRGETRMDISVKTGTPYRTVCGIIANETWTHIGGK